MILTIFLGLIAMPPPVSSQRKDTGPGGDFRAPGISLQGLLRFFQSYKGDPVAEAMVIRLIELYGLDFRPTPVDLTELKQASASEALLEAVSAAHKPPAKAVVNDGYLAVVCEPVDCDVWVNDAPAGRTNRGLLPLITRPPGKITVAAASDNHEAIQGRQEAEVRPSEIIHIAFRFKPSQTALLSAGAALLQKMLDSLGVEGSEPGTFRATGSFYIQDAGGRRVAWSVREWLHLADSARFDVSRPRERYQITRTDTGFTWKKQPKARETQDALEEAIRLMMDTQLARIVRQFREPGVTAVAEDLVPGIEHPAAFQVKGKPAIYSVTTDSAYRPSEIKVESSNPDAGFSIMYSDYMQRDGFLYPQTTQVIRQGGAGGVEARLDIRPAGVTPDNGRRARVPR